MLISEFSRQTGLSTDTVRYYIRRGLLTPELGQKGGMNAYQIFDRSLVDRARQIRLAQSLGFSLKEIVDQDKAFRDAVPNKDSAISVLRQQHAKLAERADHLACMLAFMTAKIAFLETGSAGSPPRFDDFLRKT